MNRDLLSLPRVSLLDVAYHLPTQVVTNDDLRRENPSWRMEDVEKQTGVSCRHIAAENETSLDLGLEAAKKLLAAHPGLNDRIDAIIFCTQSPDYIMPPNACLLHKRLDLGEGVLAFDINLACSGFTYAMAIARGLVVSGTAHDVLIVTAETYSKYIHRKDRSTRSLFGDGAAASWIGASPDEGGVLDVLCTTSGKHYDKFIIPAGGLRTPRGPQTAQEKVDSSGNVRTPETIQMDGMGILSFVASQVPRQVQALLARNRMGVSDVDLFLFHQASKLALDDLQRHFALPPEKIFRNLSKIGNTVSASIPIAIRDALDSGRLRKGMTVLFCGFGVGLSVGSVLVKW